MYAYIYIQICMHVYIYIYIYIYICIHIYIKEIHTSYTDTVFRSTSHPTIISGYVQVVSCLRSPMNSRPSCAQAADAVDEMQVWAA